MPIKATNPYLIPFGVALGAGVFLLDLSLPLGVNVAVLYVTLVLVSLWSTQSSFTVVTAGVGTALTILGYLVTASATTPWIALTNRSLAILVIWIVAVVVLRRKHVLRTNEAVLRHSQAELRALSANLLLVQEEERRRVSRELHDDLNQELAVLGVDVANLERQLSSSSDLVRDQLHVLHERLEKVVDNVRRMAYQLHPAILDYLGLVPALESECTCFFRRHGIQIQFTSHNLPAPLPEDIALCLYRVTQECLRNVAKHTQAKRATLTLEGVNHGVLLRIEDFGTAFDPVQMKGKRGLGLVSMEERVRLVDGTLSFTPKSDGGMQVEAWIPLPGWEMSHEKTAGSASG